MFLAKPLATLAALALMLGFAPAAADAMRVDLELVLAVDCSSSIDSGEYSLQVRGIAAAFRDSDIQGAIVSGPMRKIAVNAVFWSDAEVARQETGWFVIGSAAEAETFAARVEAMPRRQKGSTGMGEGIAFALQAIAGNQIEADRRTIDVSGDGRETFDLLPSVVMLPEARRRAAAADVTINGLAIIDSDKRLFDYYNDQVRQGPDSFVLKAATYRDFAGALRIKLFREIMATRQVQALHRSLTAE